MHVCLPDFKLGRYLHRSEYAVQNDGSLMPVRYVWPDRHMYNMAREDRVYYMYIAGHVLLMSPAPSVGHHHRHSNSGCDRRLPWLEHGIDTVVQ